MTDKFSIKLKNVYLDLNGNKIFEKFHANFAESGITVILGPNGSGKTMLLNVISGLIRPTNGEVIFQNTQFKDFSYVAQKITLLRRNVFDNIGFPLIVKKVNKNVIKKKVDSLLNFFQLSDKKYLSARKLSAGNKQLVTILRAIIEDKKLLILDEPFSNIDARLTSKIERFLLKKKKEKKIILVTHDIFQAQRLADQVIFLSEGKILSNLERTLFFSSNNEILNDYQLG